MAWEARDHVGFDPSHATQSGNRWQKAIYVYCPRKPARKESYRNPVPDVFMR